MPDQLAITELPLNMPSVLDLACAQLAGELAALLKRVLPEDSNGIGEGIRFLDTQFRRFKSDSPGVDDPAFKLERLSPTSALGRLVDRLGLTALETRLILLAGMPEQHEGFADILRVVNPLRKPYASLGLAAQLFCTTGDRQALEALIHTGQAINAGVFKLDGDGPLYTSNIVLAEKLWPLLQGHDVWPKTLPRTEPKTVSWGMQGWFEQASVAHAIAHISSGADVTVNITADEMTTALHRAASLVAEAGKSPSAFIFSEKLGIDQLKLLSIHCLARGSVPVIGITPGGNNNTSRSVVPGLLPGPLVVIQSQGQNVILPPRPLLQIDVEHLDFDATETVWRCAFPSNDAIAAELATRFPLEPYLAAQVVSDLQLHASANPMNHVAEKIRARVGVSQQAGVKLVKPMSGWADLVLKLDRRVQLTEAVERLKYQSQVINQWGFLKNRRGARGVRMLFSGPPGTGKTLTAEVLARELGVDLLVVDISQVVSKWIGETEKNLEEAFICAERTQAVLLFDEADAIFGKRTEVSDAHDRYANLETAYLLTRLERFEGLAVMSTNLRNNIDPAFTRRMEYIVEYDEPSREERLQIWRCHVPEQAPVAADVNFAELAAVFPVVGGLIRNAAVAAAYRAAAENVPISRAHLIQALKREYEKQGKSFPGAEDKGST